jgi:hypothetical protein
MPSRFLLKLIAALLAGLTGCSEQAIPSKVGHTQEPDAPPRQRFAGVELVVPSGWTSEQVGQGLLIMAPEIEAEWQANLLLEVRQDGEARSLEQALADLVPSLTARKQQFRESSRGVESSRSGLRYGRLQYTCAAQRTKLTEWEIVIELEENKRLFVLASSATAVWGKYKPVFHSFVESLRKG